MHPELRQESRLQMYLGYDVYGNLYYAESCSDTSVRPATLPGTLTCEDNHIQRDQARPDEVYHVLYCAINNCHWR